MVPGGWGHDHACMHRQAGGVREEERSVLCIAIAAKMGAASTSGGFFERVRPDLSTNIRLHSERVFARPSFRSARATWRIGVSAWVHPQPSEGRCASFFRRNPATQWLAETQRGRKHALSQLSSESPSSSSRACFDFPQPFLSRLSRALRIRLSRFSSPPSGLVFRFFFPSSNCFANLMS